MRIRSDCQIDFVMHTVSVLPHHVWDECSGSGAWILLHHCLVYSPRILGHFLTISWFLYIFNSYFRKKEEEEAVVKSRCFILQTEHGAKKILEYRIYSAWSAEVYIKTKL